MLSKGERVSIEELKARLRREKRLTPELREKFRKVYGLRFERAIKAVVQHNVYKYVFRPSGRVLWIVVGRQKDYLIYPDMYCSCSDFYLNSVVRKKVDACYHILARILAEFLGFYDVLYASDDEYVSLFNELGEVLKAD